MSQPADENGHKSRKAWAKPVLRRIELTEEEREVLRASEDPMGLLLEMKPELGQRA